MRTLIKPSKLRRGDTVGIFTPSFPAHVVFREKYLHGLSELERLGFRVLEGRLTASLRTQGYRAGSGRERTHELMELFANPEVKAIISTIGGSNSASMLEHLDFDVIRKNPKVFCGYSDVTSLHMAIHKHAGMCTFYGPAVMPSFGEFPHLLPFTEMSFLRAVGVEETETPYELLAPTEWSGHIRDIPSGAWKRDERVYEPQPGWRSRGTGIIEAPLLIANLNTVLSLMGTPHFPDLSGKIVVVEDMEAAMSQQERRWTQLRHSGVLASAKALVIGKPEVLKTEGAPFSYRELIEDIVGDLPVPRVYDFDCGHTSPMLTLPQGCRARLEVSDGQVARLFLLEHGYSAG